MGSFNLELQASLNHKVKMRHNYFSKQTEEEGHSSEESRKRRGKSALDKYILFIVLDPYEEGV